MKDTLQIIISDKLADQIDDARGLSAREKFAQGCIAHLVDQL